jgi:hypothetical protein
MRIQKSLYHIGSEASGCLGQRYAPGSEESLKSCQICPREHACSWWAIPRLLNLVERAQPPPHAPHTYEGSAWRRHPTKLMFPTFSSRPLRCVLPAPLAIDPRKTTTFSSQLAKTRCQVLCSFILHLLEIGIAFELTMTPTKVNGTCSSIGSSNAYASPRRLHGSLIVQGLNGAPQAGLAGWCNKIWLRRIQVRRLK